MSCGKELLIGIGEEHKFLWPGSPRYIALKGIGRRALSRGRSSISRKAPTGVQARHTEPRFVRLIGIHCHPGLVSLEGLADRRSIRPHQGAMAAAIAPVVESRTSETTRTVREACGVISTA